MPRKPRIELSGALCHLISRDNNRCKIFGSHADYFKFIDILHTQKLNLPFYLYAYCLMSNHVNLLIEMDKNPISHIIQRALTSNSKKRKTVAMKEAVILMGRRYGIRNKETAALFL